MFLFHSLNFVLSARPANSQFNTWVIFPLFALYEVASFAPSRSWRRECLSVCVVRGTGWERGVSAHWDLGFALERDLSTA